MSFPLTEEFFDIVGQFNGGLENLPLDGPVKMSDLFEKIMRFRNNAKPEFDVNRDRLRNLEIKQAETERRLRALEKKHGESVENCLANLKGREGITTKAIEDMGKEITDVTENLTEQMDEVKLRLAMHLSPDIEIGEAELRRRVLRKLQGIMGPDGGKETSFNAAANADDQWAVYLTRQDFVNVKLEWIWDQHQRLLKDTTKTTKRNEFIHRMSTQRLFGAALLKKEQDHDEQYSHLAATYCRLFQWANHCSIEDAAEQIRNGTDEGHA